jgi:hypothetical protein
VRHHFLRVLERAAIGEVGGNSGCPARMAANRLSDARGRRTPVDHPPGIRQASGWLIGFSDNELLLCPRVVRNSHPLRSSAMSAASM